MQAKQAGHRHFNLAKLDGISQPRVLFDSELTKFSAAYL